MNTSTLPTLLNTTVSLFPNPAVDNIRFNGLEGTALIVISDLNCRVMIKQQITSDETVSVSLLRKGVYIAKIVTPSFTVEKKLIITK